MQVTERDGMTGMTGLSRTDERAVRSIAHAREFSEMDLMEGLMLIFAAWKRITVMVLVFALMGLGSTVVLPQQ